MDLKFKILLFPVLIIILAVMVYSYSQLPFYPPDYPQGPSINQTDRILVVAPHPDDEVICNGGIIRYAVENQIPVKVVIVTEGNDTKTSPLIRHNESINGTKILGLDEKDVIFLGYRDGSLRNLLNTNWDTINPFPASDGSTHSSYPYSFQANATYSGANLASNLETIIKDFQPTVIIYPSGDDEQMDHQATSGFIEYATTQTRYNGSKYTYLLHLPPNWPYPRSYYPEYYLLPPNQLVGVENGPEWFVFNLNTLEERLKEEALLAYKTQIVPSSYLLSFLRKNELFAVYPTLYMSLKSNSSVTDYSTGSEVPPTLFKDASGDGKYQGKQKSYDLLQVGMDVINDTVWMSLKTEGNPSPDAMYTIYMDIFQSGGDSKRFEINIKDRSAQLKEKVNGNTTALDVPLTVKNNTMIIKMPSSLLSGASYFTLSADASKNGAIFDQTPWRVVKIT